MLLTDLDVACRKSGLKVVEVDGWRARGHGHLYDLRTIVPHHTATPRSAAGDYPSLGVVRDGRAGLPGPLSQLGLGRSGTVYVIAAGVAYHAGETHRAEQDNWHALGIEAEHNGIDLWPQDQYDAYVALCAALCEHYDLAPDRVQAHKEIAAPAGRKIDPTFEMGTFRARITRHMEDDMPLSNEDKAWISARIDEAAKKAAEEVMASTVIAKKNVTVRAALRELLKGD